MYLSYNASPKARMAAFLVGLAAAALLASPPAEARGPHHWHGHRGGHVAFGFDAGPPVFMEPAWEEVVYAPPPMPEPITYVGAQEENRYCREYNGRAVINGRSQPTYGTACWQPDGSWQIQQ